MRSRMAQKALFIEYRAIVISPEAKLFLIGLTTVADDYGYVKTDPKWLKTKVPVSVLQTEQQVIGWLAELVEAGQLSPYQAEGTSYAFITEWNDRDGLTYQTIPEPRRSKWRNPTPDSETEDDNARENEPTKKPVSLKKPKRIAKPKRLVPIEPKPKHRLALPDAPGDPETIAAMRRVQEKLAKAEKARLERLEAA